MIKLNNNAIFYTILIFLNLLLLIKNFNTDAELVELNEKYVETWLKFYENDNEMSLLNPVRYKYNNICFVADTLENHKGLLIVTHFDDKSCPECIYTEVKLLNKLYKLYPNKIIVFLESLDKDFLDKFDAQFPYKTINKNERLFSTDLNLFKPVSYLIDENGIVIDIHKAEKGVRFKSELFYNRFISLLKNSKNY